MPRKRQIHAIGSESEKGAKPRAKKSAAKQKDEDLDLKIKIEEESNSEDNGSPAQNKKSAESKASSSRKSKAKKRKSDEVNSDSGSSDDNSDKKSDGDDPLADFAFKPRTKRVKKNESEKKDSAPKSKEENESSVKPKKKQTYWGRKKKPDLDIEVEFMNSQKKASKKTKKADGSDNASNKEADVDSRMYTDADKEISIDEIWLPDFVKDDKVRDKKGRKKTDPDYDPTTLDIPKADLDKLTPMMQQYWKIKADNFDKLLAFKKGKWYNFYLRDAYIVSKLTECRLMVWGKLATTGFMEVSLPRFAPKILAAGHKMVVTEQMDDMKEKGEDVINREVTQVLTSSTYSEVSPEEYQSKYLLVIFEQNLSFGIVYLDTTTHNFYLSQFKDDQTRSDLRTLIYKNRPAEVLYLKEFISEATVKMFYSLPSRPTMSGIPKKGGDMPVEEILHKMDGYFEKRIEDGKQSYPEILSEIKSQTTKLLNSSVKNETELPHYLLLQALNICLNYLKELMLVETIFTMGNFMKLDLHDEKKGSLYLDSQTLANLEILEVNYMTSTDEANSLFGFIDKTRTAFGKRMLKRWLTSPLLDPKQIQLRLEAVEDLMKNQNVADCFQESIAKLADIERKVNNIYNLANKKRMQANYHEEFLVNRLNEFSGFLKDLKKIEGLIEYFKEHQSKFQSKRLKQLTTFKEVELDKFKMKKKVSTGKDELVGLFPRINHLISDIEKMVVLENNIPVPAAGVDEDCDVAKNNIKNCKADLNDILVKWRKHFGDYKNINFVHVVKRYEIEIPEEYVAKEKPAGFIVMSKRKGFLRFYHKDIEEKVPELQALEVKYKAALVPFVVKYFKSFFERNQYWLQVVACLAELDCLCSLAKLASTMELKCKPKFVENSKAKVFELKGMIHPCVAKKMDKFVPNDIELSKGKDIFLITGPNMGGKSTLLRQTCIAVVLAQMGSFVPAESFTLTPVDRIFSRIGASDRIMEGKSTFFVEMEETLIIVKEATVRSLAIIDELGRGTSTYDGVSIAYAVLKYIAENIKCMTLFATHYHLLIDEFKLYDTIDNYYMKCEFDEAKEEVKFFYKFSKGYAGNSYGITVAKMAGLPQEAIEMAKVKAAYMNKEKRNIGYETGIVVKFNKLVEFLDKVESVAEDEEAEDQMIMEGLHLLEELH